MIIDKTYLCTKNCYDGNNHEYIVVHQTGNSKQGADAKAHASSLFNGNISDMSWHFVVDDKSAYQNLPIHKGAWHVGVNYGGRLFGMVNNRNSICVESCIQAGYNANNAFNNTVEVVKQLMAENNIDADHVVSHYDVCAKNCPQQIREAGRWQEFINKISETTAATEDIWLDWTKYESGTAGFRQVGGDSGKAYGKYQFDYRYGLVPFMQACVKHNSGRYSGFNQYIALKAGNSKLINNSGLKTLWTNYCNKYPGEFEELQDMAAREDYYTSVKKHIKTKIGVDLDNHCGAVKGSAFSMSIRSGAQTAANKFSGCKDSDKDESILKKAYATYGNEDAGRWPKQLAEALAAITDTATSSAVTYRVGTSWSNGKCVNQHGAFSSLSNAKNDAKAAAKDKKKTYCVYDTSGKKFYTAKHTAASTNTTTSTTGSTSAASYPTLKKGSTGSGVKTMQTKLIAKGYSCGSTGADGAFGVNTEAAVKKFQKEKGLVVDGIVGPRTWGKLLK